jgi:glycopeptide antibiotics resistance protein
VLIVTFHPFELSQDFAPSLSYGASAFKTLVIDGWNWLGPRDFFLNILFFVPCGFLLHSLWQVPSRSSIATIAIVTIAGGVASFMIEFAQVFASRNSSAIDLVSNILGTAAGAYSYARCRSGVIKFMEDWTGRILGSKIALCCALVFAALPVAYAFEQSRAPFWRWDSHLTLQLGNEASWNRPWLGKIYLVALYRRALSAPEIMENFAAGYSSTASLSRIKSDLIALYTFDDGTGKIVHDRSRFGPALDLQMSRNGGVRWLDDSNGIGFAKRSIVKSKAPAVKLVEAVRATNELSVEVWMMPSNLVQRGPARIVSLSRGSGARNFSLSQEGADIHFGLRTPISGNNGAPVLLRTNDNFLSPKVFHIVAAYERGIERLYVNGVERPERLKMATDGIAGFATRKTPIAQFAYSLVYFFPVSFVVFMFLSRRSAITGKTWFLSVTTAVGVVGISEVYQAFVLDRPFDIPVVLYGLIISVVGAGCGHVFVMEEIIGGKHERHYV